MLKLVKANDAALSDSDIHERIAHKAYELYLQRGREHGYDLDDWLTAERSAQEALLPTPAAKPKGKAATIAHKKIRVKK
jgi:hypothetical protein